MKKISLFIIFLIRVISGIVIFRQGWEKFTGDFTLNGLVPVIRDNTDSPQWYKWFFEHIVAHTTGLFNIIVPLGEMAIGLGLILGIFAYAASFFGAFVMINYILADMQAYLDKRHRQQNKEILIRHSPGIGECFFVFKYSINRKNKKIFLRGL